MTASKLGTWARSKPMPGHRAIEDNEGECRYQTLSALAQYRDFSVEEHRLKDYVQLKITSVAGPSSQQFNKVVSAGLPKSGRLALLRGKGIEIHVGHQMPSDENTWTLPVNLISHHSEYFKAASLWNKTGKINLTEHDPIVFSLFVEWMYHTTYDTFMIEPRPIIHAKCWVLADYLLCNDFKTYAMGRLFKEHVDITTVFGHAVSYEDVQYVCSCTAPDSKLRQFYMDFVVDHFADTKMLHGDTADWDRILQSNPETRSKLLDKIRCQSTTHVKDIEYYSEVNEAKSDSHIRMDIGLAGLSIGEKETVEPKRNSELSRLSNSARWKRQHALPSFVHRLPFGIRTRPELTNCQTKQDFQFSFEAPPFAPSSSPKVSPDPTQKPEEDGEENAAGAKRVKTGDDGNLSPGGSTSSNVIESEETNEE
ncbi:hypothetical protein NW762_004096 [Fusarium torreyae]|uniref:BTB domain-containing protein n=1 Tax=Fusarium torreyae TaxID=1237075 RepID=A0A9W8VGK1_9HYPO|nr:hypothetical protein NW762_004096 [Fusarium torreyae]